MRKLLLFSIVGCLMLPSLQTIRADGKSRRIFTGATGPELVRPGEVIVKFQDSTDRFEQERAIRAVGAVSARKSSFGARYLVKLSEGTTLEEAIHRLSLMGAVEYATPNHVRSLHFVPNDPLYQIQWNMKLIHSERTWDIQQGDPSVVVAIVDTGIAFEDFGGFRRAPDWAPNVFVTGLNAFSGDSHANDDDGHGTNVASIVAEGGNNGTGYTGLAFNGSLMPVKVCLPAPVGCDDFAIAEGIDYARQFTLSGTNPVKVINLSLGGPGDDPTLNAAIDRAVSAGITVVASAGNDGTSVVSFPAAHPTVIAVGSVGADKALASYSNFGPELSVVAPGGNCDQTSPTGFVLSQDFIAPDFVDFTYDFGYCGTSQAAPHVSAVAALLYRQGITDPAAVRGAIESSAEHLGSPGARNDQYGHGLVRPDLALAGLGLGQ